MTPPAYFLGIDVGRTGLGLVVLSGDGVQRSILRRAYGTNQIYAQDPQDWWRAARTGIKEILRRAELRPDQIRCIGVTGESDGVVVLAKDGKVLAPSSLGPDGRVQAQVDELNRTVGLRNLLNLSSGPAHAGAAAVKLLWLREHEKRVWHDLGAILAPKDFLRYRLCETLVTDASDAAATLLFNPKTRSWSKQLVTLLGFQVQWLPAISNGPLISGRVTGTAARESGLQAGTPVVTGGGHAAAAAIAARVFAPGSAMIELGGNGGIFVPTQDALRDPSGRFASTCHCLAGTWALASSDHGDLDAVDWLERNLFASEAVQAKRAQRTTLDLIAEQAAEVSPGSDGLYFLAPESEPLASGFVGLHARHGRGHLARSVLESAAMAIHQRLRALRDLKRMPEEIVVVGPGAGNTLWCQILADVLSLPLVAMEQLEIAATGAAMLASAAVGLYKSIQDASEHMPARTHTLQPRKAATQVYEDMAPVSARLVELLASAHPAAPLLLAETAP